MDKILEELNTLFAPMDEVVRENARKWGIERASALREFKKSDEYKNLRSDQWALYDKLFAMAGGKTWYSVLNGRNDAGVIEVMDKNTDATIKKRNASIAVKLTKAGVTNVVSSEFTHSNDGFNGVYVVDTNSGKKKVTIDTVYAGGYNIQCLHLRVLVKIK